MRKKRKKVGVFINSDNYQRIRPLKSLFTSKRKEIRWSEFGIKKSILKKFGKK